MRLLSLFMFYALSVSWLFMRIWVNIDAVCAAQHFDVVLTLYPGILKICIGIVQVFAIFEITLKVRESVRMMAMLNETQVKRRARNLINDLIASRKRVDRRVLVSQALVTLLCLAILSYSLAAFIINDDRYNEEDNEDRKTRIFYVTDTAEYMAYGFLSLFVFLVTSMTFLVISLSKGKRKITDLP